MYNKVYLIALILTFANITVFSQQYMSDINGKAFNEQKLTDVSGSPYYNDLFLNGSISLKNKSTFNNLLIKYNELTEQIVYKTKPEGSLMEPIDKVQGFKLELSPSYLLEFISIDANGTSEFYQRLNSSDGITLLKKNRKTIFESVAYNASAPEKSIKSTVEYYVLDRDKQLKKIKKDKKSISQLITDKTKEASKYLEEKKINFKNDDDLVAFFDYYNSLF